MERKKEGRKEEGRKGRNEREREREREREKYYWEIYNLRVCYFLRLNLFQTEDPLLNRLSQVLKSLNPIFPQFRILESF